MDPALHRFEVEFRLGLLIRMLRQSQHNGEQVKQEAEVELPLPPPPGGADLYRQLTGVRVRFDCPHSRLILPVQVLDMEGDILRKGLYKQALRYCDEELRKITAHAPNTEQVRTLLVENLPRYPAIGAVAERMGLTSRTLARKLKQEQTSFTEILNQIRSEVAIYFLASTDLSVDDIAESLGFGDTSNFRYAFRRWTGLSTSHYRPTAPPR